MPQEKPDSYAGRWVARIHGRVIAQGGTPEQAKNAAQNRYKEMPEISFVPLPQPLKFPAVLEKIKPLIHKNAKIFLVGGAVRDALLGRETNDLDFTLAKDAIKTSRQLADRLHADFFPLDRERDTGRLILSDDQGRRITMDFAAFRGPDLDSDLTGRDFTLNAVAYDLLDGSLHDPLNGVTDLREKRLRMCSNTSFMDDPVRILRGVRLAAEFDLHILPETRVAMKAGVMGLEKVSPERLRDELFKMLAGKRPSACLRALDMLGALERVIPEVISMKGVDQPSPHVHDVWEHSLSVTGHLEDILEVMAPEPDQNKAANLFNGLLSLRIGRYREQISQSMSTPVTSDRPLKSLVFLAAIFHDAAKPSTKKLDEAGQLRFWDHDQVGAELIEKRASQMVLSNDEIARLELIIRNHMRILHHVNRLIQEGKPPSKRAIYRFFRDTGPAGIDICLLALADMRATYENTLPQEIWDACLEVVRTLMEAWFEKREDQVFPKPLVDGNDLMRELSLSPGHLIGELLEDIQEAQAMGTVSTRQQAIDLAREKLAGVTDDGTTKK
jgi:tRNA nucleotidyltransferase/poly(A) polymerase